MAAIIILKSDTSSGDLELKGGNECRVSKNEVVTWNINLNSGVDSITAISPKEGFPNVFTTGPCQLGGSKNWQGRIRKDLEAPNGEDYIEEDYNIIWKDSAGNEYTFDPTIRVNV